jgi:hypothetical protein
MYSRLVKGKRNKGEENVILFPSPGREGKASKLKGNKGKEKNREIPYILLKN